MKKIWAAHGQKIKFLISSLIMFFILKKINFEDVWKNLNQINIPIFAFFIFSLVANIFFGSFKWKKILGFANIKFSFYDALSTSWIGSFYSQFLPGRIGGDAVRIYIAAKKNPQNKILVGMSVIVDRLANMPTVILVGLVISLPFYGVTGVTLFLVYLFFGVPLLLVLVFKNYKENSSKIIEKFLPENFSRKLISSIEAFYSYCPDIKTMFYTLFLGTVYQAMTFYSHYLLGEALGFNLNFSYYIIFMPLFIIVSIFPISFGGWGIREATFIFFFTHKGISEESALSYSILIYTSFLITTLPGYFFDIKNKLPEELPNLESK